MVDLPEEDARGQGEMEGDDQLWERGKTIPVVDKGDPLKPAASLENNACCEARTCEKGSLCLWLV